MQREYLSNLCCILDGSGIYGLPEVPFEDFRVVAIDDDDQPSAPLEALHEAISFIDLETEMNLSRPSDRSK